MTRRVLTVEAQERLADLEAQFHQHLARSETRAAVVVFLRGLGGGSSGQA